MHRVQFLLLCLVCLTASADHHGDGMVNACHMVYPNIPGELLLENEHIVVQRFTMQPGEWEGIHRHPQHQLFIQIKGGEWTVRYGDKEDTFFLDTGAIGWNETSTEISEVHQSGNTGDEPIDLMWIGVKPGCLAEPGE